MSCIRIAVVGHPGSGKSALTDQLNQRSPKRDRANVYFHVTEVADQFLLQIWNQYDFVVITWDFSVPLEEGGPNRICVNSLVESIVKGHYGLTRVCVVGTKMDLVPVDPLATAVLAHSRARKLSLRWPELQTFPVNAINGSGILELKDYIVACVCPSVRPKSLLQLLTIHLYQIQESALDFFAAAFALPVPPNVNEPTPDPEELDDSAIDNLLQSGESREWDEWLIQYARGFCCDVPVHKITPSLVVKYFSHSELATMLYVRRHTSIPVPQPRYLHLKRWLAMDLVKGKMLLDCWDTLSWWMQLRVVCTLRGYVRQLRNLPKGDKPGPIEGGGRIEGHYLFDQQNCGPFPSSTAFRTWCEWIAHLAWVRMVDSRRSANVVPDIPYPYPIMGGEWSLSLVHGDLNLTNIMLSENGVLWLVDWGEAGYYPEWLETYGILYSRPFASFERWRGFIAGSYPAYETFWDLFLQSVHAMPRPT